MFFVHLRNPREWWHPGGGKGEMENWSVPGELKTSFVSRKVASPFRVPCKQRRQRSPYRQLLPRPILGSAGSLCSEEERLFPLLPGSRPSWNCGLSASLPPASCFRGYWTASTCTALPTPTSGHRAAPFSRSGGGFPPQPLPSPPTHPSWYPFFHSALFWEVEGKKIVYDPLSNDPETSFWHIFFQLCFAFVCLFFFSLKIYLPALGLSCSMWDLVPWSRIKPWVPFIGSAES